jgi:hypothetical protein
MGQLFAYSPADPEDKIWPHKAIREILEEHGTDDMQDGFVTGLFNKRGVVKKYLGEGGEQERQLAKKYEGDAKTLELSWPKVAKAFRKLNSRYSDYAKQEDLRAIHD